MLQTLRSQLERVNTALATLTPSEHSILVISLGIAAFLGALTPQLMVQVIRFVGIMAGIACAYCGWQLSEREKDEEP